MCSCEPSSPKLSAYIQATSLEFKTNSSDQHEAQSCGNSAARPPARCRSPVQVQGKMGLQVLSRQVQVSSWSCGLKQRKKVPAATSHAGTRDQTLYAHKQSSPHSGNKCSSKHVSAQLFCKCACMCVYVTYLSVRMCVSLFVCLCICTNLCMYVCMYVCMYIYTYIHTYIQIHTCICASSA